MSSKVSDLRVVVTSSIVSIGDVLLNLFVGILTGSTVMLAQALQGLSDLITSGLLLLGVHQSRRQSSQRFQFGYGRELFFWVLLAGLVMFLGTGMISLIMGYRQFNDPQDLDLIGVALTLLVINILTNGYALSLSVKRLQQRHPRAHWKWRIKHSSAVETKATLFVDLLGTVAALMGLVALLLFVLTGNPQFDGLGSMAIGLAMMCAALFLIGDVRQFIVGRAADPDAEKRIRSAVLKVPNVQEILDLRTMYLGSGRLLIIIEVHLRAGLTTNRIEELIDILKKQANNAIPGKHHVQIEVETPDHELVIT